MIIELSLNELERIRDFVLTYPPDMDLKHFFVAIDSFIQSNKNIYYKDINAKKIFDTSSKKDSEWYPIIDKSLHINSLFNKLEYLSK